MNLSELRRKSFNDLVALATDLKIEDPANLKRQPLTFAVLEAKAAADEKITVEGVLEVLPEGFGFLRTSDTNYLPGADDIYIAPPQIKRFGMRSGHLVSGIVRAPKEGERYFAIELIQSINGHDPDARSTRVHFDHLTPQYPNKAFNLEYHKKNWSTRIIDLLCPIGKGQRSLIVSPPRAGKTVLLQDIAKGIERNHSDTKLIVLLIDERPEEVTDMKRTIKSEVVSSTFDEPPNRHVQIAELVLEKAKRIAEDKKDVVILLDSITRLARAYNTVTPSSGRTMSGGVDAHALHKPKRFFGAARNIHEGGSLTIVATALVDTGSRMDEVIFEEFKGTGNSEIHLDRKLMEKRMFPCLDINKSATRKEELLIPKDNLEKIWMLRQLLHPLNVTDAMEFLLEKVKQTDSNDEFIDTMG